MVLFSKSSLLSLWGEPQSNGSDRQIDNTPPFEWIGSPVPRLLNSRVLSLCGTSRAAVPINRDRCLVYLSCSSYFHFVVSVCSQTLVHALQGFTRLVKKQPHSCQQNRCLRSPSLCSWGLCSCCATWGGFLTPVGFSASACLSAELYCIQTHLYFGLVHVKAKKES